MDSLRSKFEALDDSHEHDSGEDDGGRETPPAAIGQDERRMQVRAYNHWASLLEDHNFPAIDDLEPGNLPDFGPYSVLLDFTAGIEDPGISYLGAQLARECGISPDELQTLSDVPSRSLLSRITDHYMQILANQAPIGFEAEFVNQRGATILYRGILLPFSADDERIDFIYGVINWKELADQHTSDELLLQVDQALEQKPESAPKRIDDAPLTDWADGPGATVANDTGDDSGDVSGDVSGEADGLAELADEPDAAYAEDEDDPVDYLDGPVGLPGRAEDYLDAEEFADEDIEEEEEEGEDEDGGLPRPKFGSLMSIGGRSERPALIVDADEAVSLDEFVDLDGVNASGLDAGIVDSGIVDAGDGVMALDGFDVVEPDAPGGPVIALLPPDPEEMELGDWLAAAREMAVQARSSEDRTRNALYEAIGRAYDFSLAATDKPEDFEELLADSGLTVQDRAPMTPVVKLVFGADYDKTRLTEYAAALSHAHRLEMPRGSLCNYLRSAEGGLKGVVKAERALRREESGKPYDPAEDPRELLAARLRELPAIELGDLDRFGAEFALVMVRRSETGDLAIIGEVPEDASLIEKAAKKLVG